MQRVLTIAFQTLRTAVRQKLVLSIAGFLLLTVIVMPLVLKSDGTPRGEVQILLGYTQGVMHFLLAICALWVSCMSIAPELENRQAFLLLTKPVRMGEIWLGKALGAGILSVLLLAGSSLILHGMVSRKIPAHTEQAGLLSAYIASEPAYPDAENKEHSLLVRAQQKQTWRCPLPEKALSGEQAQLRFRFRSSRLTSRSVEGHWSLRTPDGAEILQQTGEWFANQFHVLHLPPSATEQEALLLTFENRNPADGASVLFDPHDGLRVMTYAGTFSMNLLKASALTAIHLLFLAALGTTLSTLFSTPVAFVVAASALLLLNLGGYIQEMAQTESYAAKHTHAMEHQPEVSASDKAFHLFFTALDKVVTPLRHYPVRENLTLGLWIPSKQVAFAALSKLVVASTLLGWLGALTLRSREPGAQR